ncbi:MAG: radical SAM protein [Candidatus Pacearchaeota archaeon]|jgi:MoaA/NifB/PqqE/SkfB family radical SAM enzyme
MSMDFEIFERNQKEIEKIVNEQIKDVEEKGLVDYQINPRAKFHLDTTKLAYHKDRVDAWLKGEKIAPITIDMALTQKCTYNCIFCYAKLQQYPSAPVKWETYEQFLDDCVEIGHKKGEGVKAISLVSDGESTENPDFLKFIRKAKENNIDMACGTNGLKLKKEELPEIVNSLTYLRFNFDAGEPEAYAQIMGTEKINYYRVIDRIEYAVKLKKELNSDITIGLQMVLLPEYADQVIPLALLGKELGVDYTVIKHCSDDESGHLGVDYEWYKRDVAQKLLKTAEALSTKDYSVQAKWSKLSTGRDRKYSQCFGPGFIMQISGSGIVAPCGPFFHKRYEQYHIGDLKKQRFKDIWESKRYNEVMKSLCSQDFDARKQCATLCLQDKVNEALYDLVEGGIDLANVSGKKPPMHINFI